MTTAGSRAFKLAVVGGVLLSVLLLAEAVISYQYVEERLVPDHFSGMAGQYVSLLENRVRRANAGERKQLECLLQDLQREHSEEIGWLRLAGANGDILAASSGAPSGHVDRSAVEAITGLQRLTGAARGTFSDREVFIITVPFQYDLASSRGAAAGRQGVEAGKPKLSVAEIALFVHGRGDHFWVLRRNLVTSTAAALSLLAATVVFFLRLPSYLRARQLQQQLSIARRVQQELLPKACATCIGIDFHAECVPAWEVGGDYYDVFPVQGARVAIVMGDVSGKGMPAALLMGLLHGAVQTAAAVSDDTSLGAKARLINKLLYERTARERFATLFLAVHDPQAGKLRYVNAGHLPPFLLRGTSSGELAVERLDIGGPVLGLLQNAPYQEGETALNEGDLLVLYSDGLVEATNKREEEFGDERLLKVISANRWSPPSEIHSEVIRDVLGFVGSKPFADDLTLLIARAGQPNS